MLFSFNQRTEVKGLVLQLCGQLKLALDDKFSSPNCSSQFNSRIVNQYNLQAKWPRKIENCFPKSEFAFSDDDLAIVDVVLAKKYSLESVRRVRTKTRTSCAVGWEEAQSLFKLRGDMKWLSWGIQFAGVCISDNNNSFEKAQSWKQRVSS